MGNTPCRPAQVAAEQCKGLGSNVLVDHSGFGCCQLRKQIKHRILLVCTASWVGREAGGIAHAPIDKLCSHNLIACGFIPAGAVDSCLQVREMCSSELI